MKAIITTIDEEFQKAGKKGMKWHVKHAKEQGRKIAFKPGGHGFKAGDKSLEWNGMKVHIDKYESRPDYSQTLSDKELQQGYKVGIARDRSMGKRGGTHMIKIHPQGKMTKISSTWD